MVPYSGKALLSLLILALGLSGCMSSSTQATGTRQMLSPLTPEIQSRAQTLRAITQNDVLCESTLSLDTFYFYSAFPEEFASRATALGLNTISFRLDMENLSDSQYRENLSNFIAMLNLVDIKVSLLAADYDFHYVRSRYFWAGNHAEQVQEKLNQIVALCDYLGQQGAKVDGFSLILTPEKQKNLSSGQSPDALFSWRSNGFGPNGDNDHVWQKSLQLAQQLRDTIALPQTLILSSDICAAGDKGLLTGAKASELLSSGVHNLILVAEAPDSNRIMEKLDIILQSTDSPDVLAAGLYIHEHPLGSARSVRRFTFDQFATIVGAVQKNCSEHPSFAGIYYGDFAALESAWEW